MILYKDRIKDWDIHQCQAYKNRYQWIFITDLAIYLWNGDRVVLAQQINPHGTDPQLPEIVEGGLA